MTAEKNIAKAIEDIKMAEAHTAQAAQAYYRARKRLEGFYSPTAPKRGKALSDEQVAHMLGKRRKNMNIQKQSS